MKYSNFYFYLCLTVCFSPIAFTIISLKSLIYPYSYYIKLWFYSAAITRVLSILINSLLKVLLILIISIVCIQIPVPIISLMFVMPLPL